MPDRSAFYSWVDNSSLRRIGMVYQDQVTSPGTATIDVSKVPLGLDYYILDIETAWNPILDGWAYIDALSALKKRVAAPVGLFMGYPPSNPTAAASLRDLYLGLSAALRPVADACDFFAPSFYLPGPGFGLDQWRAMTRRKVAACLDADPRKPIRPFLWHRYEELPSGQIPDPDWISVIQHARTAAAFALGGELIFWEKSDANALLPRAWGLINGKQY